MADDFRSRASVLRSRIMTGIIIGLARAIGETAPLVTIGALTFIAFLPTRRLVVNFRSSRSSG